mmetsp:Transcript_5499/g.13749  ORF Transcript_5499/g.13749 Transcript_5499/m.13749 type:complete len:1291 (+) Transcript_5499:328-4200(+)|eukprot:CAMPEP_0178986146 /NCGR_PEP_ID=MMETSP0795-20121207/2548_1 /TAXON_ID=88552 /ORGANISM="Amoebophrya sp., Strain Ameob2" /LENGTH=1290 /DNA_ID=CAMNT_0020677187 /DNA_START=236 /DNA_END=4108 /DNA_ORIENTATION=-
MLDVSLISERSVLSTTSSVGAQRLRNALGRLQEQVNMLEAELGDVPRPKIRLERHFLLEDRRSSSCNSTSTRRRHSMLKNIFGASSCEEKQEPGKQVAPRAEDEEEENVGPRTSCVRLADAELRRNTTIVAKGVKSGRKRRYRSADAVEELSALLRQKDHRGGDAETRRRPDVCSTSSQDEEQEFSSIAFCSSEDVTLREEAGDDASAGKQEEDSSECAINIKGSRSGGLNRASSSRNSSEACSIAANSRASASVAGERSSPDPEELKTSGDPSGTGAEVGREARAPLQRSGTRLPSFSSSRDDFYGPDGACSRSAGSGKDNDPATKTSTRSSEGVGGGGSSSKSTTAYTSTTTTPVDELACQAATFANAMQDRLGSIGEEHQEQVAGDAVAGSYGKVFVHDVLPTSSALGRATELEQPAVFGECASNASLFFTSNSVKILAQPPGHNEQTTPDHSVSVAGSAAGSSSFGDARGSRGPQEQHREKGHQAAGPAAAARGDDVSSLFDLSAVVAEPHQYSTLMPALPEHHSLLNETSYCIDGSLLLDQTAQGASLLLEDEDGDEHPEPGKKRPASRWKSSSCSSSASTLSSATSLADFLPDKSEIKIFSNLGIKIEVGDGATALRNRGSSESETHQEELVDALLATQSRSRAAHSSSCSTSRTRAGLSSTRLEAFFASAGAARSTSTTAEAEEQQNHRQERERERLPHLDGHPPLRAGDVPVQLQHLQDVNMSHDEAGGTGKMNQSITASTSTSEELAEVAHARSSIRAWTEGSGNGPEMFHIGADDSSDEDIDHAEQEAQAGAGLDLKLKTGVWGGSRGTKNCSERNSQLAEDEYDLAFETANRLSRTERGVDNGPGSACGPSLSAPEQPQPCSKKDKDSDGCMLSLSSPSMPNQLVVRLRSVSAGKVSVSEDDENPEVVTCSGPTIHLSENGFVDESSVEDGGVHAESSLEDADHSRTPIATQAQTLHQAPGSAFRDEVEGLLGCIDEFYEDDAEDEPFSKKRKVETAATAEGEDSTATERDGLLKFDEPVVLHFEDLEGPGLRSALVTKLRDKRQLQVRVVTPDEEEAGIRNELEDGGIGGLLLSPPGAATFATRSASAERTQGGPLAGKCDGSTQTSDHGTFAFGSFFNRFSFTSHSLVRGAPRSSATASGRSERAAQVSAASTSSRASDASAPRGERGQRRDLQAVDWTEKVKSRMAQQQEQEEATLLSDDFRFAVVVLFFLASVLYLTTHPHNVLQHLVHAVRKYLRLRFGGDEEDHQALPTGAAEMTQHAKHHADAHAAASQHFY